MVWRTSIEGLPKALVGQGHEVAVVLPRYRGTKADAIVVPSLTIPMGPRLRFPSVVGGSSTSGVRYFFVDDPEYFDRDGLYGGRGGDYTDNAERYSEFCRVASGNRQEFLAVRHPPLPRLADRPRPAVPAHLLRR